MDLVVIEAAWHLDVGIPQIATFGIQRRYGIISSVLVLAEIIKVPETAGAAGSSGTHRGIVAVVVVHIEPVYSGRIAHVSRIADERHGNIELVGNARTEDPGVSDGHDV